MSASVFGESMISRRHFLQAGTIAGAALGSAPLSAMASEPCTSLPPSIASLKSMRDQASPITKEERRQRQETARRLMEENHLDAILLLEGTSLDYFTGIRWWGGERLFAMVSLAKGGAFYVCPAFEEGRAREQIARGAEDQTAEVRTWEEDDNPY